MGSFSELARLAEQAAALGAAALGVNPLHALFPASPDHFGPYSPSSRLFLNVLYIDVTAVPEFAECAAAEAMTAAPAWCQRLAAARSASLVDYPAVAALKLPVLERLFTWFRQRHLAGDHPSARGIGFRAFTSEMGEGLRRQACFDALHEHALATGGSGSWQDWPAGLRDPESAEVERFAREHAERIEFHQYLQWLADEQLRQAQERRARRRHADRPVPRPRDRSGAERRHDLGQPRGRDGRRQRRRAARHPQPARPELGPGAVLADRPARARLSRRSATICAPTCATPARCASITRWG